MSYGIRRILLLVISYLKFTYYSIIRIFIYNQPKQSSARSLLLVKLDEIGDYILFRNLLKYFKTSETYKYHSIDFCGNKVWKALFDTFDESLIDSTCWISKRKFSQNLSYRTKVLKSISNKNYDVVINCSISRNYFIDDEIVRSTNSHEKIGSNSDFSNQFNWQLRKSNNYYSKLVQINPCLVFEFHRNKNFISNILGVDIEEILPSIQVKPSSNEILLKSKYVAFSLGAKNKYKIWDTRNFIKVANYIIDTFNFNIVLLGSDADKKYTEEFKNSMNRENIFDFVSKTSLISAINFINNSEFVISNDSGLAHIAAALNKRVVVIANGTHLGRFFPYPTSDKVKVFYPPLIQERIIDFDELQIKYKYRSNLNINDISAKDIIDYLQSNFHKN